MSNENNTETKSFINWERVLSRPEFRNENGEANLDEVMRQIREEANEYLSNEVGTDEIKGAVQTVFNRMLEKNNSKDAALETDTLITRAIFELNVDEETTSKAKKRIHNFLDRETKKFKDTNGAEGIVVIRKGAGGGVRYATESFIADYRKAQEKKLAKENNAK
jgi:hypothetical protein